MMKNALLSAVLGLGLAAAAAAERPNILWLIADDQGAQMGCLGTAGVATPNMDRLAREGTLFTQAFCAFGSCSPSRASMLTGLLPHQHGVTMNVHEFFGRVPPPGWPEARRRHNEIFRVREEAPTLVELLAKAGYRCGITRKFHIAPHAKFPFDEWITAATPKTLGAFFSAGDRPFFLMCNLAAPHRPFAIHLGRPGLKPVDPARVEVPAYLPDVPAVRRDWADYLGAIQAADEDVGAALAALDASGKASNTLVILAGDNGPSFHRGKYNVYDFGLRVPLVVRGPGVRAGARTDALACLTDLMPTALDYAGAATPPGLDGLSLRPRLEGRPGAAGHRLVFGEATLGFGAGGYYERTVFDGRWRYLARSEGTRMPHVPADSYELKPWSNLTYLATVEAKDRFPEPFRLLNELEKTPPRDELFDQAADPWNLRNLAADPAAKPELDRLREALRAWQTATKDAFVR